MNFYNVIAVLKKPAVKFALTCLLIVGVFLFTYFDGKKNVAENTETVTSVSENVSDEQQQQSGENTEKSDDKDKFPYGIHIGTSNIIVFSGLMLVLIGIYVKRYLDEQQKKSK